VAIEFHSCLSEGDLAGRYITFPAVWIFRQYGFSNRITLSNQLFQQHEVQQHEIQQHEIQQHEVPQHEVPQIKF
jgi:hypothetical protein